MSDPLDPRVQELFAAALELGPEERTAFVRRECAGDAALLDEVSSLLAHHDSSKSFLDTPLVDALTRVGGALEPGTRFGGYRVIQILGEGGMGTVYLAEQESPRRRVALKLVRPGAATPATLRRFEHESQVLGRLQHPGIAQVHEAGTADAGAGPQPFFAMEFVDGQPLLEHAREAGLDLRARLELLTKVCEAVHHAHQKGVIHRDLKPGNILVDAAGRPRVLDFGVARVTDAGPDGTTHTLEGQLVGTLAAMSPEQASGSSEDLDTRSDVYALGVLAHELLAEEPPYRVDRAQLQESLRTICEVVPPPLHRLRPSVPIDVSTIVSKALMKERDQRYGSAAELAQDIRRFLDDEPIAARPPSAAYHLQRLARRHRGVATVAVGLVLALAGGIVATSRQAVIAGRQRDRALEAESELGKALEALQRESDAVREQRRIAEREARVARAVSDFLQRDVLLAASPDLSSDRALTVRAALDAAASRLEGRFADEPRVRAELHETIGASYLALGALQPAGSHLERAFALDAEQLGESHPVTLRVEALLGQQLLESGELERAFDLQLEVLAGRRRTLGTEHPDTLSSIYQVAQMHQRIGRLDEALALAQEDVELSVRVLPEGDPHRAAAAQHLGVIQLERGDLDAAAPLLEEGLEEARITLGQDHPRTLGYRLAVGRLRLAQRRMNEALEAFTTLEADCRRVLGPEHPHTLSAAADLSRLFSARGRTLEARRLQEEVLDARRRLLGEDHPDTLASAVNLAGTLRRAGELGEAEALYRASLEHLPRALGEHHADTLDTAGKLGALLFAQSRFEEALPFMTRATEGLSETLGPDHRRTLTNRSNLASALFELERHGEALAHIEEVLPGLEDLLPPEHPGLARVRGNRAACLAALERFEEAAAVLTQELEGVERRSGPTSAPARHLASELAALYEAWGRPDEARAWRERATRER